MILNFIHILNICTVLLSTIGITSYRHYCQDQVKSFSFFAKLTTPCCKTSACKKKIAKESFCCSKNKKDAKSLGKNKTSYQKKACCLDKFSYSQSDIQSSITVKDNIYKHNFVAILPAITPTLVYLPAISTSKPVHTPVIYPKLGFCPPPPNTPLYILHESFLC